jgi:hypothetical protein
MPAELTVTGFEALKWCKHSIAAQKLLFTIPGQV